jgi:hypothetical protein
MEGQKRLLPGRCACYVGKILAHGTEKKEAIQQLATGNVYLSRTKQNFQRNKTNRTK